MLHHAGPVAALERGVGVGRAAGSWSRTSSAEFSFSVMASAPILGWLSARKLPYGLVEKHPPKVRLGVREWRVRGRHGRVLRHCAVRLGISHPTASLRASGLRTLSRGFA